MFIVCRFAPLGSPLAAALDPGAAWTVQDALLANLNDYAAVQLHVATGARGTPPKPLKRPWAAEDADVQTLGASEPMTFEEADDLAAKFRGTQAA